MQMELIGSMRKIGMVYMISCMLMEIITSHSMSKMKMVLDGILHVIILTAHLEEQTNGKMVKTSRKDN